MMKCRLLVHVLVSLALSLSTTPTQASVIKQKKLIGRSAFFMD